jgi:CRP/FNR family transcriptional regulator, cyclic AMP receptor protein
VSVPESRWADLRAALLACPLFQSVAGDEVALLALTRICGLVSLRAGEVVFSEGSQGDSLFVIRTGRVRTEKLTSDHDPYTVRFFETGDFFGELSLLEDVPRSASVLAETDGEFLVLSRDHFRSWCDAYPKSGLEVTRQVAGRLAERLRRVSEDVVTLFSALVNEIEQRL